MSEQRGDVRAMTEQIAKWLVDEPGEVSVKARTSPRCSLIIQDRKSVV